MESKTTAVNQHVVPQWSSPLATTAKLDMLPRGGKPRTLVLTKPSNPKASRTQTPRATSSTVAGTWNTHISPKKNPLNENSVLKEGTALAMTDSFLTGTSLSSDLNTPEIRIDSFAFNSKTVKGHETDMATNSFPEGMKQIDPIDGRFIMECLPQETESLFDPYILLDMSPGADTLQAEQLEERIDVQEFAIAPESNISIAGISSLGSTSAYQRNTLSQPLTTIDAVCVNALESQSVHEPHSMQQIPYDSDPPQLAISDDDFNIPQEVLQEIDDLFPDLPLDLDPSSTDLDMHIGTHGDLLFGAIEQSGVLDFELSGFGSEGSGNEAHVASMPVAEKPVAVQIIADQSFADESYILQPSSMSIDVPSDVQPVISESDYTDCIVEDPLNFINIEYQSTLETPKPSTSSVLHPQRPSKKRQSLDSETPTSVKRVRRTSRKPLRFRESAFADLLLQEELSEAPDHQMGTTIILKKEPEVYETTTVSNTVNVANSELTEREKYHRIRILNNEASKRCRQKRKENLSHLEIELHVLEERNEKLKKTHDALEKLRNKMKPFVYKLISQGLASSQVTKK